MAYRTIPSIDGYTKRQVVSYVKLKLATCENWAARGCILMYEQQTPAEKRDHISKTKNGCGFGKIDTPILTHIACKIKKHQIALDDYEILKAKMPKYAKQIISLAYDKDECNKLKEYLNEYYGNSKIKELPI